VASQLKGSMLGTVVFGDSSSLKKEGSCTGLGLYETNGWATRSGRGKIAKVIPSRCQFHRHGVYVYCSSSLSHQGVSLTDEGD